MTDSSDVFKKIYDKYVGYRIDGIYLFYNDIQCLWSVSIDLALDKHIESIDQDLEKAINGLWWKLEETYGQKTDE